MPIITEVSLALNDSLRQQIPSQSALPVFEPPSLSADKGGNQGVATAGQAAAAGVVGGLAGAAAAAAIGVLNVHALEIDFDIRKE